MPRLRWTAHTLIALLLAAGGAQPAVQLWHLAVHAGAALDHGEHHTTKQDPVGDSTSHIEAQALSHEHLSFDSSFRTPPDQLTIIGPPTGAPLVIRLVVATATAPLPAPPGHVPRPEPGHDVRSRPPPTV